MNKKYPEVGIPFSLNFTKIDEQVFRHTAIRSTANRMENTLTRYPDFFKRLLAHNIDLMPILGLFYLSTFFSVAGYNFLILGTIYVIYHSLFEMSAWQATPGKKWTGIKVMSKHMTHAAPFQIIVRNLLKVLSLLIFFGGFIMIFFNPKRRSLHDYIAGTLVLFEEE